MEKHFNESEDGVASSGAPHLSFSRLNRYLHCPEQYRLYYIENLRPRCVSANLVFGQAVHQALAALFRDKRDPLVAFEQIWQEARDYDLDYGQRDSWDRFSAVGQRLFRSMQWFLGAVAFITLVLGAIGVVNVMLISVKERTVEIGVRKSVGARRRDILLQFFAESFALTLISGSAGLLIGWGVCKLINLLPVPKIVFAGMIITPAVGLVAFAALSFLGIAAGLYPAYTAAEMDPIESLRYEAN